jgi:hypothetical protein
VLLEADVVDPQLARELRQVGCCAGAGGVVAQAFVDASLRWGERGSHYLKD